MTGTPKLEIERRLEVVEQAMMAHPWNLELERRLAATLGIERAAGRRYRVEVLRLRAKGLGMEARNAKAQLFEGKAEDLLAAARKAGAFGAAASLLGMLGRLWGVYEMEGLLVAPVRVLSAIPDPGPPPPEGAGKTDE